MTSLSKYTTFFEIRLPDSYKKNKDEMFTIFWTSKESYVKLLGIGIGYGLKNVDTTKLKEKIIIKKYNNYILAISKER